MWNHENGGRRHAHWTIANQRRGALIEKRFTSGLTDHEQEELQRLQELADQQLEKLDALMLQDLARLEARAHEILEVAK